VVLYDEETFAKAWNARIAPFITVFFLPIFFTYTGLRTDIHGLGNAELWGWCGLFIAVATVAKFAGCYFAARGSGLKTAEAQCIGAMMNTRGLMELIVLNVGFDLGVLPQNVFTMLVLMAVFTTVIA
jgi:Kef-type K+ transport system membrane component KefB